MRLWRNIKQPSWQQITDQRTKKRQRPRNVYAQEGTKPQVQKVTHLFVTVPHSNPGPGSGKISARNDRGPGKIERGDSFVLVFGFWFVMPPHI